MSIEISSNNPGKRNAIDDNDRKFIVATIDPEFLKANNAVSYLLTTNWLETNEATETKLACKKFSEDEIQYLHITKESVGENRKSVKTKLNKHKYLDKLAETTTFPCVTKQRHEFELVLHDVLFTVKYDEFIDSTLRILEVDAAREEERRMFNPNDLPFEMNEVTGNENYYGYRIADVVALK